MSTPDPGGARHLAGTVVYGFISHHLWERYSQNPIGGGSRDSVPQQF